MTHSPGMIFRPLPLVVFVFLCVAFACPDLAQAQKVSLRPKWVPGKKYVITQDMNSVTKIPIPNMEGDQKINMTVGMELQVKQTGDNEKKVAMSFTGMTMNMDMAGQKMKLDAADPAQKATMGAVLDMKPVFVYTNDDQFVKIESIGDTLGGPLAKMMSPDILKQMINGALETMPKEAVAVGHKWEQKVEIPMEGAGKMEVKVNYHFEKMEVIDSVNCAFVTFSGNLSGDINAVEGVKMSIQEGLFSGTMHFDPEIGYPRKQESRNRFVMKMTLPGQDQEMVIPMDQKQVVKLTGFTDIK